MYKRNYGDDASSDKASFRRAIYSLENGAENGSNRMSGKRGDTPECGGEVYKNDNTMFGELKQHFAFYSLREVTTLLHFVWDIITEIQSSYATTPEIGNWLQSKRLECRTYCRYLVQK